ncbi:penicillin-binding protein activator [Arenibaculum pallidiluteum]|uniref:penicillin-binding protein activator n=1 Tax=Arenibaculum pallidiluteum TaxID=2812559 RepID=UPI002E2A5619|nr:penicillin-binding protein activator [Arenibaculum pallidiluteum]
MARLAVPSWVRILAVLALPACAPTVAAPPTTAQAPQEPPPFAVEPPPSVITEPLGPGTADGRVQVALLLPLSGSAAEIGQGMLNAAQLALFDVAGDQFELLPRDTKGTPQGAVAAANDAVAAGADLILGPLFAAEVSAVKPVAQSANLRMLAFSNDWSLAGQGTWTMGLVPMEQVRRVTGYARSQGISRLGGLVPRSAYGDAVMRALQDATQPGGSTLVRVERYDPAAPDPSSAVRALASGGTSAFDGVVLAEGGDRLRVLAPMLPFYEIDPRRVRLLGTGLWDEPATWREPQLAGGWYAAPDPEARADFEQRYQEFFGRRPPRLATLAYDAAALSAVLARNAGPAPFGDANLTNPNGFAGADGIFRLLPNGLVERGLAVLEIQPSGPRVVDPAPETFQAIGF